MGARGILRRFLRDADDAPRKPRPVPSDNRGRARSAGGVRGGDCPLLGRDVRGGGGGHQGICGGRGVLIATGETSLFDEWGRRRDDFLLADLFGMHAWEINPEAENLYVRKFGRGRVVYSPAPYEQWYFWAAAP